MKQGIILVLGGYDRSLLTFRGPLLAALVEAGWSVVVAAPPENPEVPPALARMGVRFEPVSLARAGLNPFKDLRSLLHLRTLCRRVQPDIVLSYTIKPVIYGTLAARWAGIPRIYALITGLGAAFHSGGPRGRVLRFAAKRLYRVALRHCTKVMVQNQDIAELFVRERILEAERMAVVPGSGVDTAHFACSPLPAGGPVFLLLARMLWDKGVGEYVAAARLVRQQIPAARFLLVGDTDPNPAAIPAGQLEAWQREGVVEHRPAVSDVRPLLAACTVYVLPSYHEGMPRSVLEAMATGRPVITADVIGCKETIANPGEADAEGIRIGDNGLLVAVRSVRPLAAAMLRLAGNRELALRMGGHGRRLAEQRFDVSVINHQMLGDMGLGIRPAS